MEVKKNLITREGLRKFEEELHYLKMEKRQEISKKIAEATAQGDLSENAEYSAAKEEQSKVEARIEELENFLKNVEVVNVDENSDKITFGMKCKVLDIETKEELVYSIIGSSESDSLNGSISNESPLGRALIGSGVGDVVDVEAPIGTIQYKVLEIIK